MKTEQAMSIAIIPDRAPEPAADLEVDQAQGGNGSRQFLLHSEQPTAGRTIWPELSRQVAARSRTYWDSPLLVLAVSAFLYSVNVTLFKMVADSIPVLEVAFFRSLVSLIVSTGARAIGRQRPMLGSHYSLLGLRALWGGLAMICFYAALTMLPLADGTAIFFAYPPITAILGVLVLHEKISLLSAVGCVLSTTGVVVLTHPPFLFGGHASWGQTRLYGVIIGSMAACFGAAAFTTIKALGDKESSLVTSLWFHIGTVSISVLPMSLGFPAPPVWPDMRGWLLLTGITTSSFWAQLLAARGIAMVSTSTSAAVSLTEVVYTYIWGMIFFHDKLSVFGVSGSMMIAAGVLLASLNSRRAALEAALGDLDDSPPSYKQPAMDKSAKHNIDLEEKEVLLTVRQGIGSDPADLEQAQSIGRAPLRLQVHVEPHDTANESDNNVAG